MTATHKDTRVYQSTTGAWMRGLVSDGFTGNHVDPTIYSVWGGNLTPGIGYDGEPRMRIAVNTAPGFSPLAPSNYAVNTAWGNLIEDVRGVTATMGVTFAEGHQAMAMIAERFGKMRRAYSALRRGRFRKFLAELTVGPKRKHRNKIYNTLGEAPGLWLEYSFGWSPLLKDVYAATEILDQPLPGGDCSGTGRQSFTYEYHPLVTGTVWLDGKGMTYVKQGARVYVTNPNLYLAQQVGLANPALIAWELVPFSFMVDWVADVSSYLGSFSDLLGCSVYGAYTTITYKGTASGRFMHHIIPDTKETSGSVFRTERFLGLTRPTPNLDFTSNIGGSLKRAANAASLLLQILSK